MLTTALVIYIFCQHEIGNLSDIITILCMAGLSSFHGFTIMDIATTIKPHTSEWFTLVLNIY